MSSILSKRQLFKNISLLKLCSGFYDENRNVLVGKPYIFALKLFFFFMHYMFDRKLLASIISLRAAEALHYVIFLKS